MTLPKRFVSLLLVYCFVITVSPYPRSAVLSNKTGPAAETSIQERQSRKRQSLTTDKSKETSWLPSWLSSWFSSSDTEDETDKPRGLRFRLSQAPDQPEARTVNKVAPATLLSDAQTQAVLRRLPPPKIEPSDEADFALREKSLPPPRTGETIKQPFPAPSLMSAPEQTTAGPLEVVRYSPEGEVPLAPNLSVTFSQPMVSITSQEEAAETVPVKLSPQPPGKWRWVGTKTLLFEPAIRFPMATEYSVTVPAGTRSANGVTLTQSRTWSFDTPSPTLKTRYPDDDGTRPRDELMFIEFDQRIDPATVLRTIKVRAGGEEIRTRLATKEEIESYEYLRDLVKQAEKDRWLAFRAIDSQGHTKLALPGNAAITVSVEPGTSSVEGPRTTTKPQQFTFHTFGPLQLVKSWCSYNVNVPCAPNDSWYMEFSNGLTAETFQDSQWRVEPPVEGLKASVAGNILAIHGPKKPDTTYRVTIDQTLRDQFEQTLGKEETVEFKVGPARPWMTLSGQGFVVLDPAGPRQLSLYSVNYQTVKVSLYAVEPADWVKFQIYRQVHYQYRNDAEAKKVTLPGRLISDRRIELQSPNEMIETVIDVTPALNDGFGSALVVVESITPVSDRYHSPLFAWVQSTNMGLDAFADNDELIGWATSLADGAPLENVQLEILPSKISGRTGADGVAHLALKPSSDSSPDVLVARRGNDVAILPESVEVWTTAGTWYQRPLSDGLRWYVFDDRKLYRPGEEVHLKGWIRKIGAGKGGDVSSLGGLVKKASYSVKDEADNEVAKGEIIVNLFGGFDTAFKLPGNMNLGGAQVEFKTQSEESDFDEEEYTHRFQVQEFRRPEFEVNAKTESEAPLFVGGRADVSVVANYFAGGGLPDAEVKWNVMSRPTNFTPPNRDDYTFGKWFPWWTGGDDDTDESDTQEFTGRTDASGKHRLRIDFDSVNPPRASSVLAQASVTDVNRQTWSSTATLLVHPADLYVGLKSDRTFVQKGEPLVVQSIVTDLDGQAIANREVKMHAVLLDWKQIKGEWQQVEVNPQDCSIQSGTDGVKCTFASKEGGVYRVTATIRDQRGRANESELTLWVAGGKRPPKRNIEKEEVELIPDHKDYKPGDTASILVQAPFYPAEGVMSWRRSGILKSERFHMDGPTYTVRVPIEAAWTPNVHVQIDLVGAEDRDVDSNKVNTGKAGAPPSLPGLAGSLPVKRPAFASGELNLSIPPVDRRLAVAATPREKTLEPGGYTTVGVEVKDAAGELVSGSEVAVVVVDEAVLALTNYRLDDPISVFYSDREPGTSDHHLRQNLVLEEVNEGGGGPGGGGGGAMETVNVTSEQSSEFSINGSRSVSGLFLLAPGVVTKSGTNQLRQIRLRENFNALAVFAPSVRTDANGRAQVRLKLPDNLTRYRVMAVAVAGGKQFGSGESAITARLPLMARPSAPRFLNFGDRFELPIVLQNQTDVPMMVDVAVRATNALLSESRLVGIAGGPSSSNLNVALKTRPLSQAVLTRAGRRVTVPANDRVEVRIPAAAVKAGTARFQIGAVSGRWSDAAEISLPVWTPATTEAFATYGEIDEGAINQPVKAPAHIFPQFGGLEIETSSTQLQELTDAVLYLTSYSYECSEQLSSRIIGVAALRDVLTAFKAKDLPSPQEMEAAVTRDLKRLQGMQNEDGGFAFWRRGDQSWPYVSIHVAHALARARQKKFEVPNEMFEHSRKYLREIESHIPSIYSIDTRRAIIAYALYVRMQMDDRDPAGARKLIAEAGLEHLSLESVGWLLSVLSNDKDSVNEVAAIRHLLNNRVTETAGTAHFVCSYSDGDYLVLNSNRRADGIILEALIGNQPNNDLIPKIVRGLLAHRTRGRWENTQENVFILLALDRYFNTYEKVTPNFMARAWLGERFAGEQEFKGRSTNRQHVNVPMRYLVNQNGAQNLIISKEGSGRLYYRVGMNYAPSDLNLKPADYGFTVERSYEAVDNPKDVSRDADGSWHIKAGARVRVRLTMVAPARRYHVALVDPLPAGFESLNPALAVTESIPEDKQQEGVAEYGSRSIGYGWWRWRSVWFDHQNLRDERAEAFTALLWEGVYNYSYVARATTPGSFVVPPAKAEEMYHPETFGRGKTDRVRIE